MKKIKMGRLFITTESVAEIILVMKDPYFIFC